MSTIVRHYDASKNEQNAFFIGVPQGDIDQATWDGLPKWLQETVDASPMYRKSKPRGEKPDEPASAPSADKES